MGPFVKPSLKYFLTFCIFLISLVVYINSQVFSINDTIWSLYVSSSILQEGNTDLDEYAHLIAPDDYRVEQIGNHTYSVFPIGTPLLAVPFVFVVDNIFPPVEQNTFSDYLMRHPPDQVVFEVEKVIASIIMAGTVAVVFLTASNLTTPVRAFMTAVIFAFGTSAWSVGSRGLWQHGPSMLALSIALYLVVCSREKPRLLQFVAIPLVFAYIIRPTNLISVLIFSIYVFLTDRHHFVRYLTWLAILTLPFLIYNYSIYERLIPAYYLPARLGDSPFFLEALAGNLISPARGLLVFSPILLFSLRTFFTRTKDTDWLILDWCLLAIVILHWISISMFRHWYGGWSIGPRFFADMLPFFAYFMIPAVDRMANLAHKLSFETCLFVIMALASIFVHFRCATTMEPFQWNISPVNIDHSPFRLWDWSDIQFLRGLCPEPYYQAPKCWFIQDS